MNKEPNTVPWGVAERDLGWSPVVGSAISPRVYPSRENAHAVALHILRQQHPGRLAQFAVFEMDGDAVHRVRWGEVGCP